MMLTIIIILLIVIIGLSVRLFVMTKEIKNMRQQLTDYNNFSTEKKIDVTLLDKNIERLGEEINQLIDHYVSEKREKIRSDNELKQAIANISHDLRTPLTSIKGYIQLLENEHLNDVDKETYMNIVKDRATRLEALIKDFFELSKIESADYQLNNERFNLSTLVNEAILSFYHSFVDQNIGPGIYIKDNEIIIKNDSSAVSRVIENLLSNALFYTEGTVNIGLHYDVDAVYLWVENDAEIKDDTDNLERYFDRFYIADQSRTGQSTGLELSIVKSLMIKMGGEVSAKYESEKLTITCQWPR